MSAHFAYSAQGLGGGLGAGVYAPLGAFRVGGFLGLQAIVGEQEEDSQVIVPLAVAFGLLFEAGPLWLDLRGRVGAWTAATSDGFQAGFWCSPGFYVMAPLSERVAIGAGVEGWFAFLRDEPLYAIAPGLTLAWVPPNE